jgi:ligand-binding sensor domain-containing protein/tRNA A-37 threonylcarbamoyl transferase component Bud32
MALRVQVLVWLVLALSAGRCRGEEIIASPPFMIQQWRMEDGLPQSIVKCMRQTRDGYLWIGSGNGLARFDGRTFTVFNAATHDFFYNHDIDALLEDRSGDLWIMPTKGLSRLHQGQFEDLSTALDALEGERRFGCLEDRRGNVWIGYDGGLLRFEPQSLHIYRKGEGFPQGWHVKLLQNHAGKIVIVGEHGLWLFDGVTFHEQTPALWPRYQIQDALILGDDKLLIAAGQRLWVLGDGKMQPCTPVMETNGEQFMRIYQDCQHRVWLFTTFRIYCWQNDQLTLVLDQKGGQGLQPHSFYQDRQGTIWIGTIHGLFRLPLNEPLIPRPIIGLTDRQIAAIYQDREGAIWVGMSEGLARIYPPHLTCFRKDSGMYCTAPRVVFQDHQGVIWIGGSSEGISRYSNGRFSFLPHDREGRSLAAKCVAFQDSSGKLFCVGSPLAIFDQGFSQAIFLKDGTTVNMTRVIVEEHPGVLWIGAEDGLYRIANGQGEKFTEKDGLSNRSIFDLQVSQDGTLWICTAQGVTWWRQGRFIHPFPGSALDHKSVMEIFEDADGTIWLGAYGGLFRFHQGRLTQYTSRDGLCDNDILGILTDDSGYLWLSSIRGIFRVSRTELNSLAARRISRLHPVLFDRTDGMVNIEGNGGQHPSAWRSTDGKLWFPTMGGLVMIDPANIKTEQTPPPVYIENVDLDGRRVPVPSAGRLQIPAGTRRFRFQFTAIDFDNPRNVYFRYRLDGFDELWNETDPPGERIAHYTNLTPGNYTFRVQASSGDGIWNRSGAVVQMNLAPLYWQTAWFRGVMMLAAGVGIYLIASFFRQYYDLLLFWRRRRQVGPYVLEEIVGYGGTATVFRAHRLLHAKHKAAVKILKKEYREHAEILKRFRQEAAVVDSLDHPHIVKVFDRGTTDEHCYIAMEWLEGETLAVRLKRVGPLPLPSMGRILRQLADVLAALHRKGILHRDLKPANVMLLERDSQTDYVKVLDFGLARSSLHSRITQTGSLLGTMHYLAPERMGIRQDTPAGDIYSLGVIAFEMLTGSPPFSEKDELAVLQDILTSPIPSVATLRPEIPPLLADLIDGMMAKNPLARPTANEIMAGLDRIDLDRSDHEPRDTGVKADENRSSQAGPSGSRVRLRDSS